MNDFREYSNYLMHYGIPGQKHGIRRYQNEDGTLTEEGKRRYLTNSESHRMGYTGPTDEQKIRDYENTSIRFWGGSNGKQVYLDEYGLKNPNTYATLYTDKDGYNSTWKLSERGRSNFKHDVAVRRAAEILENLETKWNDFKRGGFYTGKEEDERRENRRSEIEDKINRAEEKAQSILKKLKNLF